MTTDSESVMQFSYVAENFGDSVITSNLLTTNFSGFGSHSMMVFSDEDAFLGYVFVF
jgi:hypothetical protein